MERIGALIQRLLEQYENKAGTENLLLTAQMLLNELQQASNDSPVVEKKIAVILPTIKRFEIEKTIIAEPESKEETAPKQESYPYRQEPSETVYPEERPAVTPAKQPNYTSDKPQYKIEDIPTFAYQERSSPELNEAMSQSTESLNDRLKVERLELGSVLKDSAVKDLRKAIGINDRFVFINELFRGDENMYERSIKTINSFSALPEAEFWIQRELKTKIGWNEGSEAVKHFDQLVRRRFL